MDNRVPIHFIQEGESFYNASPIVDIYIRGQKYRALLDTGATHSFISEDFVKRHQGLKGLIRKGEQMNIKATGGGTASTEIIFLETSMLMTNNKTVENTITFRIINTKDLDTKEYEMILGMDFFIQSNCVINLHDFFLAYL